MCPCTRFYGWKYETALWAEGPIRICALKKRRQVLIRVMKGWVSGGQLGHPSKSFQTAALRDQLPPATISKQSARGTKIRKGGLLLTTNRAIHPNQTAPKLVQQQQPVWTISIQSAWGTKWEIYAFAISSKPKEKKSGSRRKKDDWFFDAIKVIHGTTHIINAFYGEITDNKSTTLTSFNRAHHPAQENLGAIEKFKTSA